VKFLGFLAIYIVVVTVLAVGGLTVFQRSLIYFPSQEIVAPTLPGIKALRLATPDGESLTAWYLPAPKGKTMFLFLDGNGGHPEAWTERWREIAAGGAGFLAVYYRGYSGSTGHPTEKGLITDGNAGYDWLVANGYSANRIVIHGFSLGTAVAVRIAVDHPAHALILEAPFTAAADVAARYIPSFLVRHLMWDQFRSRDFIGQVRMPILIVNGGRDSLVPLSMGEELFRLANDPKSFVSMRNSSHITQVRDGLYKQIWAFLAAHPVGQDQYTPKLFGDAKKMTEEIVKAL
jgi:fermentation-respiration switch protein FrsA (DUF1100 family)